jgi:cold shock protein
MFDNFTSYLTSMSQGTIARLTDKGFGFIAREGQEKDLFFHANELENVQYNDLKEGDKVTFEVAEGPKGPNAVKVNRV